MTLSKQLSYINFPNPKSIKEIHPITIFPQKILQHLQIISICKMLNPILTVNKTPSMYFLKIKITNQSKTLKQLKQEIL